MRIRHYKYRGKDSERLVYRWLTPQTSPARILLKETRFPDRCSPGRSLRNLDLGHVLFPGVLSTRPPGATRHVPISRNVTAVVATSRSTRRPRRKKEPLGWHECAMLVCYTRIAHNLTQATVCCGESAGQFTCVGARVSRGPEQSGSCALVRCTSRAAKKLHVTNGLRDQSGGSPLKRACSACMEPLQPGHTAAAERATAATVATATTAVAPSPPLPPAPAPLPPAATAVAATAIVATTASAAPLTGTLIGTLIGPRAAAAVATTAAAAVATRRRVP